MTLAPELELATRRSGPASPYVGLVPFGEDDARFFFGRSQEVAVVSANLRSSRLTLLYGPSGVGKSSLLQAGVVHGLRREALRHDGDAPFAICGFRSWLDDPVRGVQEAAHVALQELAGDEPLAPPAATLEESLRAWTEQAGTLLVVLDQFEEYFQYHPDEGADGERELTGFAAELAAIVNDPTLDVHVLLSIREDAWARLDRFEGHIPSLFLNYLRVDHLDLAAAREAIEGPVGAWNRTHPHDDPYYVEPALADAILGAATGSGLAYAAGAETGVPEPGDRVEAPFLQLVLERLWRATVDGGTRVLSLATLDALGGARRIVERHLLDALGRLTLREQDVASDCFRFLVTRAKTKIAHPASDLAEWTGRAEREVTAVLATLCTAESGRILRAVAPAVDEGQGPSYELFHDVLADPVLAWRRRHEAERARREARRRLLRVGAAALALVAVFGALAGWALVERGHTRRLLHGERVSNGLLNRRIAVLSATNRSNAAVAQKQTVTLVGLRATNRSLTVDTAALVKTRDGLTVRIRSVRVENVALARRLRRLNSENTALAKKINALDAAFGQLDTQLETLQAQQSDLADNAAVLKRENAALEGQDKALSDENATLERKAAELGLPPTGTTSAAEQAAAAVERAKPLTAQLFVVPGDTAGSDLLRRRVESLAQQLVALRVERARNADEIGWFTKANGILRDERAALRLEDERLARTLATVRSRNAVLVEHRDAAAAQHAALASKRAAKETRNAKEAKRVAAVRKSEASLQARTNDQVGALGSTQDDIAALTSRNAKLVAFIDPPVAKLLRAARSPAQDAKLAGLLAVLASRLTPYAADDPAHPDVYNALWLTLNRLDAAAATALIAPSASATGKLGTTTSAKLEKAVCRRAAGTLTRDEWSTFLPPAAPYTRAAATPCG